jgi:hypothetical protein
MAKWPTVGGSIPSCTSKVYSSYIKRPANRHELFLMKMNLWIVHRNRSQWVNKGCLFHNTLNDIF